MWVVRAGQGAKYFEKFLSEKKIFLSWEGYKKDLKEYTSLKMMRELVVEEKSAENRTAISNWSGQLNSFVNQIVIGDFILIPSTRSQTYTLARVTGNYVFSADDPDGLYHSHDVDIITNAIPREIFPQSIVYSLGAYRTLFKVKHEEAIIKLIDEWLRSSFNQ